MSTTTEPVGSCEFVIDPGDFFGQITGAPEPAELCDEPTIPGSIYCDAHIYEGGDLYLPDHHEVAD
jgi:hypothetical protein